MKAQRKTQSNVVQFPIHQAPPQEEVTGVDVNDYLTGGVKGCTIDERPYGYIVRDPQGQTLWQIINMREAT